MKNDTIKITTYDELNQETAQQEYSNPYNIAGHLVDNTHIVCGDCVKEEEKEDKNVIFEDSESDYMSLICEDCGKPLDTYVLVYRSQDPKLWHQLVWNEQLGNLSNMFFDDEKLAKQAENLAYEEGWQEGSSMENTLTQADIDANPTLSKYRTDTEHYANNVAPELRAMCGYIDAIDKGTYTEPFRDVSYHVFTEGVSPAFHAGYYDRIVTENEEWQSVEKWELED